MANVGNLQHQTTHHMNGMRSTNNGDAGTVLVHQHANSVVVDSKSGNLIQQHGGAGTDIDGNFIHEILGMNSQIEIISEDVQHALQQQQQHHHQHQQQQQQQHHQQQQEVIVHQQENQQQQIHIQNATPEQLLELQQQGAYTQENGNRVIVVSELFKCDICNLAFIFKDQYIQHCDDHIRMVAEHINLKGIVPINNFEEANEILDFRSDTAPQQQQHHQQQQVIHEHPQEQQQHQHIVINQHAGNSAAGVTAIQHQVIQAAPVELDNSNHGVIGLGQGGGGHSLDASMIEDIDEGDPQLVGAPRPTGKSGSSNKRTSQQQLQAQLNSEWCKCLPCDFKFRTPLSLSRHLNAHMENRNRCEKCNKFFTSYVSLNTHSRQCKGDEEAAAMAAAVAQDAVDAELGGAACERGRSVSVDGPASPGGTVSANKVYNCKKCNVQFSSANQYREHKLKHSNDVYTCNECQKAFLSIINLNRHRQNEHQQRQTFVCSICNCEFTNVQFLEEHNKTRSHLHNLSASGSGDGNSSSRGRPRTGDVVVID